MVIRDLSQQGPCNGGGRYVTAYHHDTAPGGHVLFVSGPAGAITQLQLADPTYTLKSSMGQSYSLRGAGPQPTLETATLLELLTGVLTVPCGSSIDFAIALDWFNKVVEGAAGDLTDLADHVHRAKHLYTPLGDVENLKQVGRAVVDEIAEFVGQHPLLQSVDTIASPPGHDPTVLSFGSRVAAGVAQRRRIPLVRCTAPDERAPARSLAFSDRAGALGGQFRCPDDVSGRRILIVDDVYASGATAEETARALRAAGARQVMSIAAIRTMEFELDHVTKELAEALLRADRALARAAVSSRPLETRNDDDDWAF
ncbi:phosphoribosyltransferase family protein [Mycobacterium sp. NPDC051804]|uniref:phosphoribosyltransferase family protein n=1 Tax=Mycobacterium sp. NPDC051804 TaxID=3364295 RepID=UPI003798C9CC